MTLIDGKVLAAVTQTASSQVCPICKVMPSTFNDLSNLDKRFISRRDNLKYGISPLHAWIRLFEFCLHLSYKLELKTWQARGVANKAIVKAKKLKIQQYMKEAMCLIVDMPKQTQGTSNDGNTARIAFKNFPLFASILGIDEEIVQGFHTILVALSSQLPINAEKFGALCLKIAKRYVALYPWFYMPVTAHKILIHGAEIIKASALPLGMMGEDAAESRNKNYRSDRLNYARKCSRVANLTDVFNRAMDTSDPIISSISLEKRLNKRQRLALPSEVIDLLDVPEPTNSVPMPPQYGNNSEEPTLPEYILETSLVRDRYDFEDQDE